MSIVIDLWACFGGKEKHNTETSVLRKAHMDFTNGFKMKKGRLRFEPTILSNSNLLSTSYYKGKLALS